MKTWMVVAAVLVLLGVAGKGSLVTGGAQSALRRITNLVHVQGTGDEQDGDSPSQEP
jgi:hypothetical protein